MKCPNCEKKIDRIIEWKICSVGYERMLPGYEYTGEKPEIIEGDFESYSCPNCGIDIDNKFMPTQ